MAEDTQRPPPPPGRGLGLDDDLDAALATPLAVHDSQFRSKRPPSIEIQPPTPRELSFAVPRPMAMSTGSLSSYSEMDKARRIKYGEGKYADVELVPQPSDGPEDPLNWPTWKKSLHFWCLLLAAGLANGTKTALIPVNAEIAREFRVSHTAAASLTAVPLVIAAFTGVAAITLARMWGKRPVYLGSMAFLVIGCIWAACADSYGNCMGARLFQGLGWGAFDVLLLGSIQDTYFEHEHNFRLGIYHTVTAMTTWGPPLLGGVASRNAGSFTVQFRIIIAFLAISAVLLVLGAPESAYDRSAGSVDGNRTPPYAPTSRPTPQCNILSIEFLKEQASQLRIVDFRGEVSLRVALQALRTCAAPTVAILSLATFLPHAAFWGLLESMAMQFSPAPFNLSPAALGSLLAGPFITTLAVTAGLSFWFARRNGKSSRPANSFSNDRNLQAVLVVTCCGTFLCATGLFAYSLYIQGAIASAPRPSAAQLRFVLLSFLLGLLAAGCAALAQATRPLVARSAHASCVSTAARARTTADMHASIGFWLGLMAGVLVAVAPAAVDAVVGLKDYGVGVGVAHVAVVAGCVMLWRVFEQAIQTWDARIMGLVDASEAKRSGSFFDWD